MTSTRQAILILGMHRSGTSAMAGISCLLGAGAPAGMMEAALDNPTGFWESLPITALNEAIFRSAGCGWYDSLTFDSTAIDAGSRDDLAAHCASVLTAEFGNAPSFVMKDPRFSVLLDLWLPVFATMNVGWPRFWRCGIRPRLPRHYGAGTTCRSKSRRRYGCTIRCRRSA